MTTETTIPEVPTTTVEEEFPLPTPETACPPTWQLHFIDGHLPVCLPIEQAPPEPPAQPVGVNVPTVTLGANMPTTGDQYTGWTPPAAQAAPPTPAAAVVAEVAVAPAQTLPMTGAADTFAIGLIAAVVVAAGLAMWRAARRPKMPSAMCPVEVSQTPSI